MSATVESPAPTTATGARSATLAILRIAAGLLFWQHGAQKLFGWLGGSGPVELVSLMGLAGGIEFVGGILIAVGLFTRGAAVVTFLEMVVAYVYAHMTEALWPIENRGELALIYAAIFLHLVTAGPGRWSLDGWRQRR